MINKYTVKIDNNGYVSGFGLASTSNTATPYSDFIIRADRFSIASPSGPGITPVIPFIVTTTTTTINGVTVNPGVYINGAFIQGGSIQGANIAGGTIENSKLINVSANKITGAALEATSYIESAAYIAGSQGWKIHANGTAEFAATSIRGQLTAGQIDTRNLTIKDSFKQLGTVAMDALKGIRTGLAATGIGLFLVALGTIVAYWDDIKEAVSGVSAEQKKLNELSHANFETAKEELSTLDAQDNILKLQGKSEKDILQIKIKKIDAAIELGKLELANVIKTSKAEEEATLKNYKLTKQVVDFILDTALFLPKLMLMPIDMAIKGANKVSEALGFGKLIAFDMGKTMEDMQDKFSGFIAGSLFDVNEVKAEGEKTRKELEKQIQALENQKAGFQLTLRDLNKPNPQEKIKEDKKEIEDVKKKDK